jgi:hypothetical protein
MKQILIPFIVTVVLLSGCSGNNQGRLSLRGTVSVNGVPIKTGTIIFAPMGDPAVITHSGAAITDGKYAVAADKGVTPGEYRVQIFASEDTGKVDMSSGMPVKIMRPLVPPKYNEKSELTVSVAKGKSYDFDLAVDEKDFQ